MTLLPDYGGVTIEAAGIQRLVTPPNLGADIDVDRYVKNILKAAAQLVSKRKYYPLISLCFILPKSDDDKRVADALMMSILDLGYWMRINAQGLPDIIYPNQNFGWQRLADEYSPTRKRGAEV